MKHDSVMALKAAEASVAKTKRKIQVTTPIWTGVPDAMCTQVTTEAVIMTNKIVMIVNKKTGLIASLRTTAQFLLMPSKTYCDPVTAMILEVN